MQHPEGKMTAKEQKNLTFRLPDDYHRQLYDQAERQGLTMNAHLMNIVSRHLQESGYFPNVLKSASGRLFEIEVENIPHGTHSTRYFCARFDITEIHALYKKRRAKYVFGLANELIQGSEPYQAVKDLGFALLHFYNRGLLEIDQLAWQPGVTDPNAPRPNQDDNWRYIGLGTTSNLAKFFMILGKNQWKDPQLILTGESQDLRYKLRSEDDLYNPSETLARSSNHADFERYAADAAVSWIKKFGELEINEDWAVDYYNDLPRYVQKQIDVDEYCDLIEKCYEKLRTTKRKQK